MSQPSKQALIKTLRGLLGDAFTLQHQGAVQSRLGRSYGYADGYMRVLLDTGVLTQAELLEIVGEERSRRLGPPTRTLSGDKVLAA